MAKKSEERTIRLVSQRDLRALADQCEGYQRKAATASGHMRELVGEYVQKKNLHKGAFSTIMRLRRLESGDLWLWKAHFDDYWQKLGLERQANEQAQMLPSGVDEDGDGKVARMPRRVSETAGEAAE